MTFFEKEFIFYLQENLQIEYRTHVNQLISKLHELPISIIETLALSETEQYRKCTEEKLEIRKNLDRIFENLHHRIPNNVDLWIRHLEFIRYVAGDVIGSTSLYWKAEKQCDKTELTQKFEEMCEKYR
jgi:hypothetical protein